MLKEHELIVLTADIPGDEDLQAGDVGTIIHVHPSSEAYVVEFMTFVGSTVSVATVPASHTRPIASEDIPHARRAKVTA